jgi:branched-chain amino acid transport system substrate-binding protein
MKKLFIFGLLVVFSFAAFAAPTFAAAPQDPDKFKFGLISPITGHMSWLHGLWGPSAEQAVEEINAAGGIFGKPMEVIFEDHKSGDPKAGVSSFIKLADMDKVPFVVQTFTPPNMATQPIAAEKKILQINPGAWSPKLLNLPYLFNSRLVGNILAEGGAKWAWDQGYRKAAILHPNDASGIGLKDYIIPIWKKWGGKIVATETAGLGSSDFHVQLAKIRARKPDVIFDYFYSLDLGYSLKQARELGMEQPMVGMIWNEKNIAPVAGKGARNYFYVEDYFNANSDKAWTRKFVEGYKKRTGGKVPIMYAANTYEIVYILKDLIEEARKKGGNYYTGENLKDALLKIRTFDTVYEGKISFRDDGSCTKPMAYYKVGEDGKKKLLGTMSLD